MNTFGQSVPVRDDETGKVIGSRPSVVSRVTRDCLDGSFGCDKGRAVVVSLLDGDIISMKPLGRASKTAVRGTVSDLFRYLMRCQAGAMERRAKAIQKSTGGRLASAMKQARKEAGL